MRIKSVLIALGIALAMVVSLDFVSYAAKGRSFLLGRLSYAKHQTSLGRTQAGAPLGLYSKPGSPPLLVNSGTKVAHLNADSVDGYDASALRNRAWVFTRALTASTSNLALTLPLPAGTYLVSYSAYLPGAAGDQVGCWIGRTAGSATTHVAESRFDAGPATPGLTGTGLVTKGAGVAVSFNCSAANPFVTDSTHPLQVVATRVDTVTSVSARR
jgi:hypothetical protein